jgi:hypothetical protein
MRNAHARIVIALVLTLLSACHRQEEVRYEPPLRMTDLAAGVTAPEDGYALLTDAHTVGRFTCPLAVAKLAPQEDMDDSVLRLTAMRPAEEACWTDVLRGVDAIRFVLFMRPTTVAPKPGDLPTLCRVAHEMGAPLLVVYAPNGLGPNSAQVLGVLYDTAEQWPIATFRAAEQYFNDDGEEESPNDETGDLRSIDARYQAQRAFERYVRDCLRDLIERDEPPATTQPHRWKEPVIDRYIIIPTR